MTNQPECCNFWFADVVANQLNKNTTKKTPTMTNLLKEMDIELSPSPTSTSAFRLWRLELSDLVSLRFSHVDVSDENSPTCISVDTDGHGDFYNAVGTPDQRAASQENRALACLLRKAVTGTDAEPIVMATDAKHRASGTHLLRLTDKLQRSKTSASVMQAERNRLDKIPRMSTAGFEDAAACIEIWANSILRDVVSVNTYADKPVDVEGGARKLNLKLKVDSHRVAEQMIVQLASHPVFGKSTLIARLRTRMRTAEYLNDDDSFSLEKFIKATIKAFEGHVVETPRHNPHTAYSLSTRPFDVSRAFGNVRSDDRSTKGYNPRMKCYHCRRIGFRTHECKACFPHGTASVPCPWGFGCSKRKTKTCQCKHDGTTEHQNSFVPDKHKKSDAGPRRSGTFQQNSRAGSGPRRPRRAPAGQMNGPPNQRRRTTKPNQPWKKNCGQVNWIDKPLNEVPLERVIDLSKANPSHIGTVFVHEMSALKRPFKQTCQQSPTTMQTGDNTHWLVDSGASVHVVNDQTLLHNLVNRQTGGTVAAAGGSELQVTAVGEIHLMITHATRGHDVDDEQQLEARHVVIKDVWCCPEVRHQVLSTEKLTSQLGMAYVKEPDKTGVMLRHSPAEQISLHTQSNGLEFLHGRIILPEQVRSNGKRNGLQRTAEDKPHLSSPAIVANPTCRTAQSLCVS